MPLSEHEQRILEEIERRLAEEDPRLVEHVGRTDLYSHLARRIRLAALGDRRDDWLDGTDDYLREAAVRPGDAPG